VFPQGISRRGGAHQGWRIWHYPNDARSCAQSGFEFRDRHAGRDGNQQVFLGESFANFSQNAHRLIRFYRQDQNLGELRHVRIERGGFRPGIVREGSRGVLARVARHDLFCRNQPRAHEPFGQSGGHLSRAQKSNPQLSSHARHINTALHPGAKFKFTTQHEPERQRAGTTF